MSKVVELKLRLADDVVAPQARFVLAGDQVRTILLSIPAEDQIREILERGLPSTSGRVLRPADGIEFLEALPRVFVGSRFWATELMDMEEEEALKGHREIRLMDREGALGALTRAVVAAFPDRIEALLDVVERAFRMHDRRAADGFECVFCGRAQGVRVPLWLPRSAGDGWQPSREGEAPPWGRDPAESPVGCADCLRSAADGAALQVERVLADCTRAVAALPARDEAAIAALSLVLAEITWPLPGTVERCVRCLRRRDGFMGRRGGLCTVCAPGILQTLGRDGLTRLPNRTMLSLELDEAIARSRRGGGELCIAMIDVDGLAPFNYRHGHPTGDRLLIRLCEIVASALRPRDRLFRYGGEELVVILPRTRLAEGVALCEHARVTVETRLVPPDEQNRLAALPRPEYDLRAPNSGAMTVSIGVVALAPEMDRATLLQRAEERVYDAKSEGRNCVRE